jgi:hypothetical protein
MSRIHVASLLLAAVLFIVLPASAANTITFDPASVTVSPGSTASFTMRVDSFPGGLAGYDGHISIGDPNVAVITAVMYPSWAILNHTEGGLPSGRASLRVVDLGSTVGPGAVNIDLATITVQGNSAGTTTLTLTDARFDADDGNMIAPLAAPVSIAVPGTGSVRTTTSSGSTGGTSSSSSGTSYEPVPVARYTLQETAVQPASTSGLDITFTVSGTGGESTTPSSGSMGGGGGGGLAAAVAGQNTPPPATTSPNPGIPAQPLTWIAGGVVVLVIIACVVYLTFIKKI